MDSSFKPLRKEKILDLSRLLPGPFCSFLLAERGAKVLVVHHPTMTEVLSFPALQKGKTKLLLDFKNQKDLLKFKKLVISSDVILEGFRPGVMTRLGIGFKELKKLNPRIILASLSGYGKKGGDRAGHDLNYLSLSGMISALAAGRTPQIPGVPIADLVAGMNAAFEITAALKVPLKKRKALHLDLSIHEAARKFLVPLTGDVLNKILPIFSGGLARYHLYQTQNKRWLAVAPLEEKFWVKFIKVMEIPSSVLQAGETSAVAWLEEKFQTKTQEEWLKVLKDPDLCVTPVV